PEATAIGAGWSPPPVGDGLQRLKADRGDRGVAAAQPDHDELARRGADEQPPVRPGQRGEEADDERAEDVHDQRAPRKGLADEAGRDAGAPVARPAAARAAHRDPDVAFHRSPAPPTKNPPPARKIPPPSRTRAGAAGVISHGRFGACARRGTPSPFANASGNDACRSTSVAACGHSMPSRRGSHSDISGMYVTSTRNTSMVSSHGHTAIVSSVMPILAMPDAT